MEIIFLTHIFLLSFATSFYPYQTFCINNFIMYNTFIHEKKLSNQRQLEQSLRKQSKWHRRYHTQIQPILLQHYDKRINSFIHNIEEKPIIINPENITLSEEKRKPLIFKNVDDWRSFYNVRERQEIKCHQSFLSQKSMKEQSNIMPSLYSSPFKAQYRERLKQKEIHPPMRYNNLMRKQISENIKSGNHKKQNLREFIKVQRMKEKQRKMSEFEPHQKLTMNNFATTHTTKYEDEEGDFLKLDKIENIEIQARIYEKKREIIEKKLHFKKLMDLSVTNPVQNNRREYKRILERCGVLKRKNSQCKADTSELDKFSTMVETNQKVK